MSELRPDTEEARERLRQYLVDTSPDPDRADLEARFDASAEWREALERERAALERLDALPDKVPSQDLSAAVLRQARKAKGPNAAPVWLRRVAVYAVVLVVLAGIASFLLPSLARSREAARRASAQNTLKQWGIIFKMYAGDHQDQYPPLTRYGDEWVPDLSILYPKYVTDPGMMVSSRLPNAGELTERLNALLATKPVDWAAVSRIVAQSYTYAGFTMTDASDLPRIKEARARNAPTDSVGRSVIPLREGVERFLITDINNPSASLSTASGIPVMFENVAKARDREFFLGANVLYLDGHVEFIRYGEAFPVTDAVAETLSTP